MEFSLLAGFAAPSLVGNTIVLKPAVLLNVESKLKNVLTRLEHQVEYFKP